MNHTDLDPIYFCEVQKLLAEVGPATVNLTNRVPKCYISIP